MPVKKLLSYIGIDLVTRCHEGNLQEVSHSDAEYGPIHTPLHISSTFPLTWQLVRYGAWSLAAIDTAYSPFFVGRGHGAKKKIYFSQNETADSFFDERFTPSVLQSYLARWVTCRVTSAHKRFRHRYS